MRTLKDIGNIFGKTVFLRLDLNVPVVAGVITDEYRLQKALPTITTLRTLGAKLIIGSHIDETPDNPTPTLGPIYEYLHKKFPGDIVFVENYFPENITEVCKTQQNGQIVLLENLRKYSEEKNNDEKFAKHLASFADLYVDDAFATAHRKHASIIGIPKYIPGVAGPLIGNEIRHLSEVFKAPHPFIFILGGAKFETKLPLVKKFLHLADRVFVGGALANDLFKAQGFETGKSLLSDGVEVQDLFGSEKLLLPKDVVISNEAGSKNVFPNEVQRGDIIVDAGPETLEALKKLTSEARFILWNGPLGNFEIGFKQGTLELAEAIAQSMAQTIVGGGDTLEALPPELEKQFTFVSTGGGAMLDFLAHETLPGIQVLDK